MPKITSRKTQYALLPLVLIARAGTAMGLAKPTLRQLLKIGLSPTEGFEGYTPTRADIIVASYAKSGTNWSLQIALQLAHRGRAEFGHVHELVPWPDGRLMFKDIARLDQPPASPTGLRVIKTHLGAAHVPYSEAATYLCMLRDPKEVVVSAYHFFLGLLNVADRVSPREWAELWISDDFAGERWAEHCAGFWALRERPNVIVRSFGRAKRDLPGLVDDLAGVLDLELEPGEREAVIERSSLPYMRAHEDCFAPPAFPMIWRDTRPKMIRRGESGRSDELLDAEIRARIDEHARAQLRRLGSDLPYDELFSAQ